jgi:hypothetical protein
MSRADAFRQVFPAWIWGSQALRAGQRTSQATVRRPNSVPQAGSNAPRAQKLARRGWRGLRSARVSSQSGFAYQPGQGGESQPGIGQEREGFAS